MTLVPRVLLSAMLAGPTPSGSASVSRLCRGCSHPPRRFPDQAAPSFAALLRQGQRWMVFHLHSNQQRLTAHKDHRQGRCGLRPPRRLLRKRKPLTLILSGKVGGYREDSRK
jgi:hypothetical protein